VVQQNKKHGGLVGRLVRVGLLVVVGGAVVVVDGPVEVTTGTLVGPVTVVVGVVDAVVVVAEMVADRTVDTVVGAAGPLVPGTSIMASGTSACPAVTSGPVVIPTRNRAAVAAPRIAPTANRPCPLSCASTVCIYRVGVPRSSRTTTKHHLSTSACSSRIFCQVSSSAGV
jgi:hypothetical protein